MSIRYIGRKYGAKVLKPGKPGVFEPAGPSTKFEDFLKLELSHELVQRTRKLLSKKNWSLVEGNGGRFGLQKTFPLPTFRSAFDFMTLVAVECKLTGHHPTWANTYNEVDIYWTTHDSVKGLTQMDIEHAEFCENQFRHITNQLKTSERLKAVRKWNDLQKAGLRTTGNQPKTATVEEAQSEKTVEEPKAGSTDIEAPAGETQPNEMQSTRNVEEDKVDAMSTEPRLADETQIDEAKAEEPKAEEPKSEASKAAELKAEESRLSKFEEWEAKVSKPVESRPEESKPEKPNPEKLKVQANAFLF
ncbi:pterin 4 alpha carbinolamine dehydratase-domain-containing protein [Xylariaceae sp. FL1272]|nr:pterin 4 alpha carbinolamine dehydratase-domain-containing protein [Xylariaceae sp. FL1272]